MPELRETLSQMEGLEVVDDIETNNYPTPYLVNDKDGVFVGRLRNDVTAENSAYMWVVSDNLRKGAATNAVQIAEKLLEMGLVK
jgi:aspartate-semialdehyde dehydrogenase